MRQRLFGALFSLGQVLSLATPVIFGYLKDNNGLNVAFTFILVLAIIALIVGVYIYYEEKRRPPAALKGKERIPSSYAIIISEI